MRQELPLPAPGSLVRARGRSWRVVDAVRHENCGVCRLACVRPAGRPGQLSLIVPFDRLLPIGRGTALRRCGRGAWVGHLRRELAQAVRAGALRSAAEGRFDLLSYQLEPTLAALHGETRLLIADEVGLGKTVQAALLLAEVLARDPAARCLVLTPAALCRQWTDELRGRFHLPAVIVDAATLRRLACVSPPGSVLWDQQRVAVASFDYVKRADVLPHVQEPRWDVLVVDEAHLASMAPARAAAVHALARRARRLALLTATPYASDSEGFRALCSAGRLPGDRPIAVFRRNREDIGRPRRRKTLVLRVRLSAAERRMHAALERYTADVWRHSSAGARPVGNGDARLAMIVLRKRAASGPWALFVSLTRRLALLDAMPGGVDARQLALPLEPDDDQDPADEEPCGVLGAPGLADPSAERERLSRLLDLARAACATDSKAAALHRFLRRAREPVLVFTEYRDTLARLAGRLGTARPPALLHGGLDVAARTVAVDAFTRGEADVLLATDAAAHGLNLQARCRIVVNVELPWTPSRLEQRVGRVDRIGQANVVHAVHLLGRGSGEDRVLARLVLRVDRERLALGTANDPIGTANDPIGRGRRGVESSTGPDGEMDVARILIGREDERRRASAGPTAEENLVPRVAGTEAGGHWCAEHGEPDGGNAPVVRTEAEPLFRRVDLAEVAKAERLRLSDARQLIAAVRALASHARQPFEQEVAVPWTIVRRRRAARVLPAGLICLLVARFIDGRGARVQEELIALHVALAPAGRGRHVLARAVPWLVGTARPNLLAHAMDEARRRLDALNRGAASWLGGLASREAAMTAAEEREPLQPSLFDGRAVRRAAERRRWRDQDADTAARRIEDLGRQAAVELAGEPALVLVLAVAD